MAKTWIKTATAALAVGLAAAASDGAMAQPHGARPPHGVYRGYHGGGYYWRYRGYRAYPWAYGWYGYAPGPWGWWGYPPYGYGYYDYWYGYPPPAYYPRPAPAPPPAPPPPTSAPQPAGASREFIVYFAFDDANLGADAKRIVDDSARYDAAYPGARVTVVGYTDAAGSEDYNQALSQRRSQTVREALVADGVPADSVDMAWRGERDQAVKTPQGAREPANRRVTIVISPAGDRGGPAIEPAPGDGDLED